MSKPRVVKDFDKIPEAVQSLIKLEYTRGFEHKLITYTDNQGKFVSALPFETENYYCLIRMTKDKARDIIDQDDDFDNEGNLREEARERLKLDIVEKSTWDEDEE